MKLTLALLLITFLLLSGYSKSLKIDKKHRKVGFETTHMFVATVEGYFHLYEGEIEFDSKGKISKISAFIDVSSINTGIEKRDNDLRSKKFFNVKKYPEIKIVMTKYDGDDKSGIALGMLTLHGIKKEIALEVKITSADKVKMIVSFR